MFSCRVVVACGSAARDGLERRHQKDDCRLVVRRHP